MTVKGKTAVKPQRVGNKEFGAWLAKRREELGLTRREVAEGMGVGYSFVSMMETGYRIPATDTVMALARVMDVDPGVILTMIHPPEMVDKDATMTLLQRRLMKSPKLQTGSDPLTILSAEIDDNTIVVELDDDTVITLTVKREAKAKPAA
jgi:Predicted transcriptional regulators